MLFPLASTSKQKNIQQQHRVRKEKREKEKINVRSNTIEWPRRKKTVTYRDWHTNAKKWFFCVRNIQILLYVPLGWSVFCNNVLRRHYGNMVCFGIGFWSPAHVPWRQIAQNYFRNQFLIISWFVSLRIPFLWDKYEVMVDEMTKYILKKPVCFGKFIVWTGFAAKSRLFSTKQSF